MARIPMSRSPSVPCVTALAAMVVPTLAAAVQFEQGDFSGSFDTTLTYGAAWRVEERDTRLLGPASTQLPNRLVPPGSMGGTAYSVNGDDGNLNYERGEMVSNLFKLTAELDLHHRDDYGVFLRGLAFYDFESENGRRSKIDLTDPALGLVGSDADLLDAYAWGRFRLGGMPGEARLGRQVVNWGESVFIQGGINAVNPVNVALLRSPGAELREALLPVGLAWGSLGVTVNQSVELFYQFDWEQTDPEPSGSYFSTNDFATAGGSKLMLGFGRVPDIISFGAAAAAAIGAAPVGVAVPRAPTDKPEDGGQYGLAYRFLVPDWGDTEFGLYYLNYHSRLPIVSAIAGTPQGLAGGDYVGSARYFTEYPEDIRLFGASFNTQLGTTGFVLQGEISHRLDVPLQVDDVELLYAALSPLALAGSPAGALFAARNQVAPGGVGFNTVIPGYVRLDVTQIQAALSRVFGNVLGASQFAFIVEAGLTHVNDMPSQNTLRLEVPGTYTSGNPAFTAAGVQPATEPAANFADATSWGYVLRGRLTYDNAIGAAALLPYLAFRQDVNGNSPGPGGNFLEGRKAMSAGVGLNYRNQWAADLSYNAFFGGDRLNLLTDRDFVACSLKYAF